MKIIILFLICLFPHVVYAEKVVVIPITKTIDKTEDVTNAAIYFLQKELCMIKYNESCEGDLEAQLRKIELLLTALGGDINIKPPTVVPE